MTASAYRNKTPVLCMVRVLTRESGSTCEHVNGVIVAVEFPDQIEEALIRRMAELERARHWAGYVVEWEWVRYLPKTLRPAVAGRFLPQ